MRLKDTPIQRKLMTVMLLTSGVVLLLTCVAFFTYEFLTFRQTTVQQLSTLGEIVAANSTAALAFDDQSAANEILAALQAEPHIVAAILYDQNDELFAQYPVDLPSDAFPATLEQEAYRFERSHLVGFQPIVQGGRRLGTLYLKSDMGAMYARFWLYGGIALGVIALSLLLAYLLSRVLQRQISRPILALAETAQAVSDHRDYSVRATKLGTDEVGLLTDAFNHMLTEIQAQTQALGESEARVRAVFNSSLNAVVVMDRDGLIIDWNAKAEKIFGWTRSEALGRDLAETIIPPRYREAHRKGREHFLRTGEGAILNQLVELSALRRDSSEFPVELCVSSLITEGRTTFCGFVTDLSERKAAEERIRKTEEHLQHTLNLMSEGYQIIDHEWRYRYLNDAVLVQAGSTREALLGKTIMESFPGIEQTAWFDTLRMCMRERVPKQFESEFVSPHGHNAWYLLSVQPIPEGLAILSQDITERKKHERGLIEAKESAEEISRMKSTLLTNMSHEIRTPLTAIIGFSDFLQKGVKPEQREEFAQFINMSAHRLMETLNSVMDLAQLEGGGLKLEPRRIDVNSQVRETISLFELQAREKRLRLAFHASETPVEALLDPVALNRVLTNLLANALKFTHTGSITVVVEARDKQVEIRVQDTGIGISKSFLPHIFDEFKQESEGLARDYEGNGLGLTITKQLVELMEGQIDVESEKGKGSTFRIVLPALSSGADAGLRRTQWHPAQPGQPAVKRHLLLVEDNVVTRELMMHLLSETFDVQAVADGPSALERAARVRYNAVLLDINLGIGMSGEEVLQALRDLPGYSDVPVMAVTAHALPGDRDRFLKHGFDGYLSKPFTSEQLLQALALVPELKPQPERPGDESLTELLQMCMNRGLIDRYELDDASLVLVSEIAHYRLTRKQAPVALHALLGV